MTKQGQHRARILPHAPRASALHPRRHPTFGKKEPVPQKRHGYALTVKTLCDGGRYINLLGELGQHLVGVLFLIQRLIQ